MVDVQAFPWPLLLACLVHVLAGLLLLLTVEGVYVVLLVFGAARLPAGMGTALAFLLAALRHFAVIAAMVLSVLAPLAMLQICRYSSTAKSATQLATMLLLVDYALIFSLTRWLRKKMFPARLKALGYSY